MNGSSQRVIFLLVTLGGAAALGWEAVWQLRATLALGVSAKGAAITLAVLMGGMAGGSLFAGRLLKDSLARPLRLYGLLELGIGVSGLTLAWAFSTLASLDASAYSGASLGSLLHLAGIAAVLGPPSMLMGASIPVLGLVARQYKTSIGTLYSFNVIGAATGVLLLAFIGIPKLGVAGASSLVAAINFTVAGVCWFLPAPGALPASEEPDKAHAIGPSTPGALVIAFATGVAVFALEVGWFRALRATFHSTTVTFAILLAAVLIAIAVGARIATRTESAEAVGDFVTAGAILALASTPVIERFPEFMFMSLNRDLMFLVWFLQTIAVIGPPTAFISVALPWLLDRAESPQRWAHLYTVNTLGAVVGALGAAWVLLPSVGVVRTIWIASLFPFAAAIGMCARRRRLALVGVLAAGSVSAIAFEKDLGVTQILGVLHRHMPYKVLEHHEEPDASISVIEFETGQRVLTIDGFAAATQGVGDDEYMKWMGHLPMAMHPDPERALVICFGTGQTANAVRMESPDALDLVDLNGAVFKMGHHFATNHGVLDDERVDAIVMDGRAWLRRTERTYDVITLEPMPPNHAGVNALYSKEFYELAAEHLSPDGVIAQWLPFHLVNTRHSKAIAATFHAAFPNSALWIHPHGGTGILLGRKSDTPVIGTQWPGLSRDVSRSLTPVQIASGLRLVGPSMLTYIAGAPVVTDDNQLLAYGLIGDSDSDRSQENHALVAAAINEAAHDQ